MLLSPGDPAVAHSGKGTTAVARVNKPAPSLATPASVVEAWFLQGKSAHGAGELARAEELYGKVLEKDPAHAGALNAMGVLYANTDRLDKGIALFHRALLAEPQASHVYNNLGYALLLAGKLDEADSALQRALDLSPARPATLKNQALLAQAKLARAVAAQPVTAVTEVNVSASPSGQTIVAVAPNVYALRDKPAATGAVPSQATPTPVATTASNPPAEREVARTVARLPNPQSADAAALRGVKIEVSNGVGIRYMARRTAERLAPMGLVTTRLTNQAGFRQMKTEIQFSAGQQGAADALSAKLPVAVQAVPTRVLGQNVQMRLVLGRDLAGKAIAAWLQASEASTAAVVIRHDGWLWA
ncbi:MAG: LytR C-terminal domain-containing protein [Rhodoferax sp.]